MFMEEIQDAKRVQIIVEHTLAEEKAKELVAYFRENYPNAVAVELHPVTPAVGAHIGCGCLGVRIFYTGKVNQAEEGGLTYGFGNMKKKMLEAESEGRKKYAVDQFNINNLEWTKTILTVAEEMERSPSS